MSQPEDVEPVTARQAGQRLDNRAAASIRYWAIRYNAVQLRKVGRVMYYDYKDLAVIEREIRHGHPVPPTPELRAEIRERCPLKVAELHTSRAA